MIRAAGVIFISDGKVLLLKRSGAGDHVGEWGLPGGAIEDGETPEEAARRECDEEISYVPDGRFQFLMRNVSDVDYTTFVCKCDQFLPRLNSEHSAYAWVPIDEATAPLHAQPIEN